VDGLVLLDRIGAVWTWVAFAAWLLALAGMVVHIVRTVVIGAAAAPEM
jgi:hypothetical protein